MFIVPVIVGIVLLLICLYLLAIKPGRIREGKLDFLRGRCVAHRGLFNKTDIPENSMKAFRAAVEYGYPIELDVQLTADEKLVVFHDETLKRMCKIKKKVWECTYEELLAYGLLGTNERIPLLSDVLDLVDSRVPLLIEIKPYRDLSMTVKTLGETMRGYEGDYAVQSFHPGAVAWYKRNVPEVPRGILATDFRKNNIKKPFPVQFVLTNLLFNFWAKPDFIAYNHKYADQFSYRLARKLYKFENAAWTIRSQKELDRAKKIFSIYIFDSFIPK